jgi:para-nitrobenzyl esterase
MNTIVETSKGKLQGTEKDGFLVFRGIPFAQPPVGDLRFRAPLPSQPWDGVREATHAGPMAMQIPLEALDALFGRPREPRRLGEDCLYLNVWTPGLEGARRPVMVWIHGGGFTSGGGSEPVYSGAALASRDVVVVTINYRLGALGFLYAPDLADQPDGTCANFGILDQIAALEWVRDEIAAFGGDPNNVTIFGESAGGMSVGTLMGSPMAAGLFQKAILQSGAAHNALTVDEASANAALFAKALGVERLKAGHLRAMPATEIIEGQRTLEAASAKSMRGGEDLGLRFQPVIDGRVLAKLTIDAIRDGSSKDVPVLIGTNADEWKLFVGMWPRLANISEEETVQRLGWLVAKHEDNKQGLALLQAYRDIRAARGEATDAFEIFCAAQTDRMFRVPADRLAEAQAVHQTKVFMYRFDWRSPIANGFFGACHALELPFVFGTYRLAPQLTGEGPEADALAKAMVDAWVAFARSGDPSTDTLRWPAFDAEHRRTMILGRGFSVEEMPREAERRYWDGIIT